MKALLITAILIGLMALAGWLTFSSGDGAASVTIDTDKVKSDTAVAVEKTKELAKDGADAVRDGTDGSKDETEIQTKEPETVQ